MSDTPETDAESFPDFERGGDVVITDFARNLERERNAAISALESIKEIYIDGCDTYEDWKAMGTIARKFLENN